MQRVSDALLRRASIGETEDPRCCGNNDAVRVFPGAGHLLFGMAFAEVYTEDALT